VNVIKRIGKVAGVVCVLLLAAHFSMAQRSRNSSPRAEGWVPNVDNIKTAREAAYESGSETPTWTNRVSFERDVFTFARVRYTRLPRSSSARGGFWYSDFPDSDLNLSFRLQQLTSLKVDPNGRIIDITDPELFNYPWTYMVEPGLLFLEDDEVPVLRNYLLNGGFLMADDFWGDLQWENFESEIKKVFPEYAFVELPMDHQIFRCVYQLEGPINKLQVPNVDTGRLAEQTEVTWEVKDRIPCKDVHIKAIFDPKGRLMVIACHNTDYGDGWERENDDDYFFHRFSEKIAYPLAINIIFYAMTH
jgi:hypothetical protein